MASTQDLRLPVQDPEMPPRWVRVSVIVALTIALLGAPLLVVALTYVSGDLTRLRVEHSPAMIGVPWAGGAAFIVVLVLRSSFGRVEFNVLGFEFKGGSGPIVMWVLCFLAEVAAIKVLWNS